jgi:anti-sigma factor RsiW
MSKCFREEILQSYVDGELSHEALESVTSHLVSCANCAGLSRQLESENSVLFAALAPEFEASVPTQHLRQRIDAAIAGSKRANTQPIHATTLSPVRSWLHSVSDRFSFAPQRAFAYSGFAALLILGFIFAVTQRRALQTSPATDVVATNHVNNRGDAPVKAVAITTAPNVVQPATVQNVTRPNRQRSNSTKQMSPRPDVAFANHVRLLPGERSYLQTIAQLDSTIKQDRGRMKPAIQAEYERNLAFVDRALAAARTAAKSNPNDPDAAEFMFSAYQSKVDLLNTVADARVYDKQR